MGVIDLSVRYRRRERDVICSISAYLLMTLTGLRGRPWYNPSHAALRPPFSGVERKRVNPRETRDSQPKTPTEHNGDGQTINQLFGPAIDRLPDRVRDRRVVVALWRKLATTTTCLLPTQPVSVRPSGISRPEAAPTADSRDAPPSRRWRDRAATGGLDD